MVLYDPSVFVVHSIEEAKQVILTDEGIGTDTRWESETPYLVDLIKEHCQPAEDRLVLDYGCGIGRLARPLAEQYRCNVIGVDISAAMRALASVYTNSGRLMVGSPNILNWLGVQADFALAVWTLQHCFQPADDLELIKQSLKPGGRLFVVNNFVRAVPIQGYQWACDDLDIQALLDEQFERVMVGTLDPEKMGSISEWTYYGVWKKEG